MAITRGFSVLCAVYFVSVNFVYSKTFVNELITSEHHTHCTHEHPKEDQVSLRLLHIYKKIAFLIQN